MKKFLTKLPILRQLDRQERLAGELWKLCIEQQDRIAELEDANNELKAEVEEWKDGCKLRDEQFDTWQKDSEMWHRRWDDEHEKYMDLCHEVQLHLTTIKDSANAIFAASMNDT